ncbi:chloride channel protein [Nocardia sp. XZ_19_385]|uniref:chloride channel protein n=1 Tax=Nocardia sp. XZ_19_385 TaxID=2769488 RepID=UPI00188E11B2|nr:chloride channel protein [Nocardia sp. XZ_19_385]
MPDISLEKEASSRFSRWARWGAAALVVSVAAGLGAAALQFILGVATALLLESAAPELADSAEARQIPLGPLSGHARWALPVLLAAVMAAVVGLSRLARGRALGTDEVIAAARTGELRDLTTRAAAGKLAGTAATLGAGGSGGTEGPVAVVSAALSGAVTRAFRLPATDRSQLVAVAMGVGVGALFQAPLGGALLAGELLRRRGIDWRATVVALPLAFVAFGTFIALHDAEPMFGHATLGALWSPGSFVALAAVGVCGALAARMYVGLFTLAGAARNRVRRFPEAVAALAGALVGIAGIFVPAALGTGYGTVAAQLSATTVAAAPLWLLAVLPLAKIVTTSITLRTGGVGGVFGPAMVIGAAVGALCWRGFVAAGFDPGPVALFTMAGMAATLGPAVRAPAAALLLAAAATGNLVPPVGLVGAVGIALCCSGGVTLFPSQAEGTGLRERLRRAASAARSELSRRSFSSVSVEVSRALRSVMLKLSPQGRGVD